MTGRVGGELDQDQGYAAARLVGLSIFASLQQELGDLDRVDSWIKALGLVQCAPGFDKPPAVINGFTARASPVWAHEGEEAAFSAGEACWLWLNASRLCLSRRSIASRMMSASRPR